MNKKQNIYNYILLAILVLYNFLYHFVILRFFRNKESIITSIFFAIVFIVSVIAFGFSKAKLNIPKRKSTRRTAIIVAIAIAVTYCVGVFVGFLKNGYSLAPINIIKNTFAPLLILIFTEMFTYNCVRTNKNKFKNIVWYTVLLTILEIQMNMAVVIQWGWQEAFIVTTALVIPIIAKNMILSYLSYEVGYQPCLIYRLILELYIYFVPFLPKFGDYLNSMFGLILPMIVFMYTSADVEYEQKIEAPEHLEKKSKIVKVPMYIFIFTLIALISRIFPVFMIGIGSESMTGAANKGDAVVAVKVKEEDIEVNDIIVFQTQDKILIHRVVEIENINGVNHYRTKGDVNSTRDNVDVTIDKIYGEVKLRIPYIAFPSVKFSEFMQKHK